MESGAWMEFSVYGKKYGMLAEGDERKLIFQDSRYLRFERTIYNKKYNLQFVEFKNLI